MKPTNPKRTLRLNAEAREVPWLDVVNSTTPPATDSWTPIPHTELVQSVFDAIFDRNLVIPSAIHSLSHAGLRYFGLLDVRSKSYVTDHSWVVGVFNSHDRRNGAEIMAGVRLFASNVVVFSDEVNFNLRHSKDALKKLPTLVNESVEQLHTQWSVQDKRLEDYKSEHLSDEMASHLIIRALDKKIIHARDIPNVLKMYRKPIHESFGSRTAWSLFNAIATPLQTLRVSALIEASIKLHRMFDSTCKFNSHGERFIQPPLV